MIVLINPNTSAETTDKMLRIARGTAGRAVRIEGAALPDLRSKSVVALATCSKSSARPPSQEQHGEF